MPELKFLGGINQQKDTEINILECTDGQNFKLDQKTLEFKRREAHVRVATSNNSGQIYGFMQLIKRNDTQTQLVHSGTAVYEWDLATTFTTKGTVGVTAKLRGFPWILDDILIIVDRQRFTTIQQWDGTTFGAMVTGLSNLKAMYGVVHNGRVFLFNCEESGTDYSHVIMASEFENQNNFSITDQGTEQDSASTVTADNPFFLVTPDLKPINGVVSHLGSLIISTQNGRLFRLIGDDATNYNFIDYYAGSASLAVPGSDLMASIGNDVVFVREGPAIELLSTTEKFGDTAVDDLSLWIPDEMITNTADFRFTNILYDRLNQQIIFFVKDRCLVLDKTRLGSEISPWTIYKTDLPNSPYLTQSPTILRDAAGLYVPYFGYLNGIIFKFNGGDAVGDNDGTEYPIEVKRSTKILQGNEAPRTPVSGELFYKRATAGLTVNMDIDFFPGQYRKAVAIPLDAKVTGGGAPTVADQWDTKRFSPPGRGDAAQIHFTIDTSDPWQIDKVTV